MNRAVTERDYPVRLPWVLKSLGASFLFALIVAFLIWFGQTKKGERVSDLITTPHALILIMIAIFFPIAVMTLWRATFHYSAEDRWLVVRQGVVSRQERVVPYGSIQNISFKQDVLDRILGLATIMIESASPDGADAKAPALWYVFSYLFLATRMERVEAVVGPPPPSLGFSGNRIVIGGLSVADAEALRGILLQKMKGSPA